MFGKSIYLKLYLSFLVIFLVTLVLVLLLSARFYGSHLKHEMVEHSLTEARFLRDEMIDQCGALPLDRPDCRAFLGRLGKRDILRFGILDPSGRVLFESRKGLPRLNDEELQRAASGVEVMSVGQREPPRVALPVADSQGRIQSVLVLQRAPFRERFPRFPLGLSLVVASIAIAVMVLPLSHRFTRPLRELHGLARRWAEGHLGERANVRGGDEIAELGRVFNGMADNLQKMLQQKKEFLALISHELKSPVARMRIAAEILAERHSEKDEAAKLVKSVQKDLDESEKMIEQLLLISRIEMDVPSAVRERVDVGEIVARAIEQVDPVSRVRGIRVQSILAPELPALYGDGAELQRAVANLVENAVKFSAPENSVEVRATSESNRIRISVADSGIGVPADERERIFEPFFRGKRTANQDGSGLGLFLARRIVERYGGSISAADNIPAGTVICIELPVAGS